MDLCAPLMPHVTHSVGALRPIKKKKQVCQHAVRVFMRDLYDSSACSPSSLIKIYLFRLAVWKQREGKTRSCLPHSTLSVRTDGPYQ